MDCLRLEEYTLEGNWSEVEKIYNQFREAHTATITNSVGKKSICVGTALHVAIELNKEEIVNKLVQIIIKHKTNDPLKIKNESGDTPLHVAASRGFVKLCRLIIGEYKERIELVRVKNKDGETPLFLAALNWRKRTFAYLSHITRNSVTAYDLTRKNGDTILHCAIKREYSDLAVIIMHCYEFLGTFPNEDGITPLKVLATRPSAFKSGSRLSWWMQIPYHTIHVEPLDVERMMKKLVDEIDQQSSSKPKFPKNYDTLFEFFKLCKELALSIGFVKNKEPTETGQPQQDSSNRDGDDTENPQTKEITHQNAPLPTDYFHFGTENPRIQEIKYQNGPLPPNHVTSQLFIQAVYMFFLGLSGVVDMKWLIRTKKKHQWSSQLLEALMNRAYEAFTGRGGNPGDKPIDDEIYNILGGMEGNDCEGPSTPPPPQTEGTPNRPDSEKKVRDKPNKAEENVLLVEVKNRQPLVIETQKMTLTAVDGKEVVFNDSVRAPNDEDDLLHLAALALGTNKSDKAEDLNETAFLLAAGNGIVEMVRMILDKIPSAIHNTNAKKENVLLVAVKNRQPLVIEELKKRLITVEESKDVWENLILAANDDENTMLHLAANALDEEKPWQIAGTALQMMWDIKWYEYIKGNVKEHFCFRSNKDNKTAGEIFKESHKKLVEESSTWLKDTSESCSVVAALVAGVSFATASSVPGGTNDQGEPPLEGHPAFDAFAISSLIGLFFSVTGLIMFLTILTSRKEAKDFRKGLQMKLLLGLSSLFVAIVAMFVAFSAGHELIINHQYRRILIPFYAAASLPVAFYAVGQFPLYLDLLRAIVATVPEPRDKGDDL